MNPHSILSAQRLTERALLFCSLLPDHSLTPFLRAKALALSREPTDPAAFLELRVLFELASGRPFDEPGGPGEPGEQRSGA